MQTTNPNLCNYAQIKSGSEEFFSKFLENIEKDSDEQAFTKSQFQIVTKSGEVKIFSTTDKNLETKVKKFMSDSNPITKARKLAKELMKPQIVLNTTRFNFPVLTIAHTEEF